MIHASHPTAPPRGHAPRIALLALALLSPAALAQTAIKETRPLDATGRVEIENVKGRIEVRAWDRNEVAITGTLGKGVERLRIEGDRRDLSVKVQYPERGWGGNRNVEASTLILQVPLRASLEIESVAATVDVRGVAPRELEVDSVSGDVTIAGAPGKASIETVSGSQSLTLNTAGDVSAESVSGNITLRGRLRGALDVESVSGDMQVDSNGEQVRGLDFNSVSGDLRARVGLANGARVRGETVSGGVRLQLPKAFSARVNAQTFSGNLSAPGAAVRKEGYGPGSTLERTYGSGSSEIKVETFSGNFTLTTD